MGPRGGARLVLVRRRPEGPLELMRLDVFKSTFGGLRAPWHALDETGRLLAVDGRLLSRPRMLGPEGRADYHRMFLEQSRLGKTAIA